MIKWDFPNLHSGNEQGYSDPGTEMFKGSELIDNLAREICQNSLDAKDKEKNEPVRVSFNLKEIEIDSYDALKQLKSLVPKTEKYWGNRTKRIKENEFVQELKTTFSQNTIRTMIISDYNTTGLTGIYADHDDESAWRSLVSSDGSSEKDDDTSGGNYGIGKNAPFACSSVKTVFYNTRAKDNGCGFQGTARWISMYNENNEKTVGVGHYLNFIDDNNWRPIFPSAGDSFAKLFSRSQGEYGTDVIIIGFDELDSDWKDAIAIAVLKNFFVAIIEKMLVVEVGDLVIDSDTIDEVIDSYSNNEAFNKTNTNQLYKAYTDPTETFHFSILNETDNVTFRIRLDDSYSKIFANFRNNGMLIDKYSKRAIPVFAAVLVVNESYLSRLLRLTEPPRHNVWDYKRIKTDTVENKNKRKTAKKALDQISNEIVKVLDKYSESEVENQLDSGIGEYLSYDDENGKKQADDKLRVSPKISSIRSKNGQTSYSQGQGESAKGKAVKPGLKGGEPNPKKPHPKPKKPTIKTVEGTGDDDGATKGAGKLLASVTDILTERIFPINEQIGRYKTVLTTCSDHSNIFIKISAARDDGKSESLSPLSYTINKNTSQVGEDGLIGPVDLKAGEHNEIFIEFSEKESMALSMLVMEKKADEKK